MTVLFPRDEAADAVAAFNKFATEAWTLCALALCVTILRTYAKATSVGWKRLQADDYLAWVGAVSSILLGDWLSEADS